MTIAAVADTHTALWHLFDDARLSPHEADFIADAAAARHKIAISSISMAEIVYLVEKNRLPSAAYEELARAEVPDMPDRMIAATAAYFDVPVISRDKQIRAARVKKVW